MKTYRTETIDGVEIISGFDIIRPDRETTKINAEILLKKTDEYKEAKRKEIEFKSIEPPKNIKIKTREDQIRAQKIINEYNEKIKTTAEKCQEAKRRLSRKQAEIRAENIVYFEPRKGEIVPTDQLKLDALKTAAKALKPNQYLTPSGDIVVDERGTKFVLDDDNGIRACEIKKFGETKPEGAIDMEKLTPAQILKLQEAERLIHLGKMKPEEIEAEKIAKKQAAQQQAVEYRYKLELELEPDEARQKTKEFYNGLIEKIDSYYNVENDM